MTYEEIANQTGSSVDDVRDLMARAVMANVHVSDKVVSRRCVVPIDGVDPGVLVMGEGRTKELAVIAALRRS